MRRNTVVPTLAAVLAVIGIATIALQVRLYVEFDSVKATQWVFSYDHGFIKRGLIGTIYQWFSPFVSENGLYRTIYFIADFASFVVIALVFRAVLPPLVSAIDAGEAARRIFPVVVLLSALLLTGPGLLRQFYRDMGRFDVIAMIILCVDLLVVQARSAAWTLVSVAATSTIAILVHEGFFFWVAPMGLAMWYLVHRRWERVWLGMFAYAVFVLCLTAYVGFHSYRGLMSYDAAKAMLEARSGFPSAHTAVMVQYLSLKRNVALALGQFHGFENLPVYAAALVILVYWGLWSLRFLDHALKLTSWDRIVVGILTLSPLSLFAFGFDHARWFAMINGNLFLIILFLLPRIDRLTPLFTPVRMMVMSGMVLLQLWLGPFGITTPFR